MADGAELVTLKLTFWYQGKQPGDLVQVRRDELPSWHGFAVPVENETPAPTDTSADTPKAAAGTASKAK